MTDRHAHAHAQVEGLGHSKQKEQLSTKLPTSKCASGLTVKQNPIPIIHATLVLSLMTSKSWLAMIFNHIFGYTDLQILIVTMSGTLNLALLYHSKTVENLVYSQKETLYCR